MIDVESSRVPLRVAAGCSRVPSLGCDLPRPQVVEVTSGYPAGDRTGAGGAGR